MNEERLQAALDMFATFLRDKYLALPKHRPCIVQRVYVFLLFAQAHGGHTFEETL